MMAPCNPRHVHGVLAATMSLLLFVQSGQAVSDSFHLWTQDDVELVHKDSGLFKDLSDIESRRHPEGSDSTLLASFNSHIKKLLAKDYPTRDDETLDLINLVHDFIRAGSDVSRDEQSAVGSGKVIEAVDFFHMSDEWIALHIEALAPHIVRSGHLDFALRVIEHIKDDGCRWLKDYCERMNNEGAPSSAHDNQHEELLNFLIVFIDSDAYDNISEYNFKEVSLEMLEKDPALVRCFNDGRPRPWADNWINPYIIALAPHIVHFGLHDVAVRAMNARWFGQRIWMWLDIYFAKICGRRLHDYAPFSPDHRHEELLNFLIGFFDTDGYEAISSSGPYPAPTSIALRILTANPALTTCFYGRDGCPHRLAMRLMDSALWGRFYTDQMNWLKQFYRDINQRMNHESATSSSHDDDYVELLQFLLVVTRDDNEHAARSRTIPQLVHGIVCRYWELISDVPDWNHNILVDTDFPRVYRDRSSADPPALHRWLAYCFDTFTQRLSIWNALHNPYVKVFLEYIHDQDDRDIVLANIGVLSQSSWLVKALLL